MSGSLQAVADAFRGALPAEGVVRVPIEGLDRTGVCVTQANLAHGGESLVTGHGYGLVRAEADLGALGELCEEVLCGAHLSRARIVRASFGELVRSEGAGSVVDPLTLCLPAGSEYGPGMELAWVEARRWPDGRQVLVPADWAASHSHQLPGPAELIVPITNGLGAGLDLEHAVAHGVMELLQRDGNVLSYRALDRGTVVELDEVRDPVVRGLLDRLGELGIEVTVKLASDRFGIANLVVVGDDRGVPTMPLQVTACGEAAHPDRERGLRKALLEFCGSRARKVATHGERAVLERVMGEAQVAAIAQAARPDEEEPRALAAMVEWLSCDAATLRSRLADSVFSRRRTVRFSELPTSGPEPMAASPDRLAWLSARLAAEGLEILVVDCSPAEGPVRAVKVIVPGLECETMSYGRIGARGVAHLRGRDDELVLDRARDGAARVRMTEKDEAGVGGPAWFDVERAARLVGPLYPLYREPGCFSAQTVRQREGLVA